MGSLVRAANLQGYDELVRELGADPCVFLSRYHISIDTLNDDKGFIPLRSLLLLIEFTSKELGCSDFGMRLAQWQGLNMLGPIAVIARHADTLLQAFEAIAKYLYLHSPGLRLGLVDRDSEGAYRFQFDILDKNQGHLRQPYELSLANGARIIRLLGGEGAHAIRVSFKHKQLAPIECYRETYDCTVKFEQNWNGFILSSSLAHRKIDTADPDTLLLVTEFLESQFAPGTASTAVRVAELISKLMPTGQCNEITVATQLAMHPRTLQRRLSEESTSFKVLVDEERQALAVRYLSHSGLPLSQVSGLLGYSEQSAFNRACQRWFGMTPKQVRTSNR